MQEDFYNHRYYDALPESAMANSSWNLMQDHRYYDALPESAMANSSTSLMDCSSQRSLMN